MFKSTDSLSKKRTRTCEGTTTRSISDTITSAPRTELRIRESTAKSNTPTHCYTGLDSTSDSQGWLYIDPQRPTVQEQKAFRVGGQQEQSRLPTSVDSEAPLLNADKAKIFSVSSWCQFPERSAATLPNLAWLVDRKGR